MDVLVSCVAENNAKYFERVRSLAISLRRLSGSVASSPFVANFVGGIDPGYAEELGKLDVELRIVGRWDETYPYANKLRMLELSQERSFDLLLALDCDTVLVGDPRPFLKPEAVGAVPAWKDHLSDEQWRRLLGELGLVDPGRCVIEEGSERRVRPYFNSGLLLVPQDLCEPFLARWSLYVDEIPRVLQRHRDLQRVKRFIDQLAITCIAAESSIPLRALPLGLNCPTTPAPKGRPLVPTVLLHYGGSVDEDGFLLEPFSPALRDLADRFNRVRAELLRLPYTSPKRPGLGRRLTPAGSVSRRLAGRLARLWRGLRRGLRPVR